MEREPEKREYKPPSRPGRQTPGSENLGFGPAPKRLGEIPPQPTTGLERMGTLGPGPLTPPGEKRTLPR